MKHIVLSTFITLATLSPMTAQINTATPSAFMARSEAFGAIGYHRAAIDQLQQYLDINPEAARNADLTRGLALARAGRPGAVALLERYQRENPWTGCRVEVETVLGNCCLDAGEWEKAIEHYEAVGRLSLGRQPAAEVRYNKAAALLMTGVSTEASELLSTLTENRQLGASARFYLGYIDFMNNDMDGALGYFSTVTDTSMPAALAPWYMARIYSLSGNNDRTLAEAKRTMANDKIPRDYRLDAARMAGEALYGRGEVDLAIPYLRQYVDGVKDPVPSALYVLGMSNYGAGEYRKAIEALRAPSSLPDAMGQSALLTTGQCYLALGDNSAAVQSLNRAVELDADPKITEEALYNYAVARSDGGRVPFAGSASVYEQFLNRFPRSRYATQVSEFMAYGYMTDDNYEAALAALDRATTSSPGILMARQRVLYVLGSRDLAADDVGRAISYLKRALDIEADGDVANECLLLLGDCYYKQKNYQEATQQYRRYLKAVDRQATNRPLALYNLGYSLFGAEKYSDSRSQFEEFVKTPGALASTVQADALARIGDCYYASRDLKNAANYYDRAARLDPASADYALYQHATVAGWQGNTNGLIDGLNKMIARYPSSPLVPQALLDIAETQGMAGRIDEALVTYRRVEREYPGSVHSRQAMLQAGTILASASRSSDAAEVLKRLIKGNSPSAEATQASKALQEIAASQGQLDEYLKFMASVPNAPSLEPSEVDRLTFTSARNAAGWNAYLSKFPTGEYACQAMLLIAQDAAGRKDHATALVNASRLLERYPGSEDAVEALAIKADAEMATGDIPAAHEDFSLLEKKAGSPAMLNRARMGRLMTARDLGNHDLVIDMADKLLASSTLGADRRDEITFMKAVALSYADGKGDQAVKLWQQLSKSMSTLVGTKSCYYLAQYYYDTDDKRSSRKTVDKLLASNTPHSYWLARGYILMSDLYRAQGDNFEADEYLKSLRSNYPGSEPDIFNMIDQRLSQK